MTIYGMCIEYFSVINVDCISISVPQTIPVSVIPTVDGDNVLFQVIINVSTLYNV